MSDVAGMCLKHAEHWFECADGPAAEHDAFGNRYVILCSGGVREEAQRLPALFEEPAHAARAWIRTLEEYCDDFVQWRLPQRAGARLCWRIKPELNLVLHHILLAPSEPERGHPKPLFVEEPWYTIYSRLSFPAPEDVA
jgi:hypothetical protein